MDGERSEKRGVPLQFNVVGGGAHHSEILRGLKDCGEVTLKEGFCSWILLVLVLMLVQ